MASRHGVGAPRQRGRRGRRDRTGAPPPPATPLPPATYIYRFTSHDVRPWNIAESIRRSRAAVTRAGGTLDGGVAAPPPHTRRWCVLRSPHVNKKSREHFVRVQHVRSYRWSLPAEAARGGGTAGGVAGDIARRLPANVAVKVTERVGGVAALGSVWAMLGGRSEGGGGRARRRRPGNRPAWRLLASRQRRPCQRSPRLRHQDDCREDRNLSCVGHEGATKGGADGVYGGDSDVICAEVVSVKGGQVVCVTVPPMGGACGGDDGNRGGGREAALLRRGQSKKKRKRACLVAARTGSTHGSPHACHSAAPHPSNPPPHYHVKRASFHPPMTYLPSWPHYLPPLPSARAHHCHRAVPAHLKAEAKRKKNGVARCVPPPRPAVYCASTGASITDHAVRGWHGTTTAARRTIATRMRATAEQPPQGHRRNTERTASATASARPAAAPVQQMVAMTIVAATTADEPPSPSWSTQTTRTKRASPPSPPPTVNDDLSTVLVHNTMSTNSNGGGDHR